jgi:hypothetical protein
MDAPKQNNKREDGKNSQLFVIQRDIELIKKEEVEIQIQQQNQNKVSFVPIRFPSPNNRRLVYAQLLPVPLSFR